MSTLMSYGDYNFSPVPMISLSRQWRNVTEDGRSGELFYNMTLDGVLTPLPDGTGGVVSVEALQETLLAAVDSHCELFTVSCDGTELISTYPRVTNIQLPQSQDNWVYTSPYTIEMEFDPALGD